METLWQSWCGVGEGGEEDDELEPLPPYHYCLWVLSAANVFSHRSITPNFLLLCSAMENLPCIQSKHYDKYFIYSF